MIEVQLKLLLKETIISNLKKERIFQILITIVVKWMNLNLHKEKGLLDHQIIKFVTPKLKKAKLNQFLTIPTFGETPDYQIMLMKELAITKNKIRNQRVL